MDSWISTELSDFPSTHSQWKQIIATEKNFYSFHSVVLEFLEEIKDYPIVELNLMFFYKELLNWTCKGLKSLSPETSDLLRALQVCLNRNVFLKDRFEEFVFSLKKCFEDLLLDSKATSQINLVLETFKTLALSSKHIIFLNDRESFREDLINCIIDLLKWIDIKASQKLDEKFLFVLSEMVEKGKFPAFKAFLLEKKCVLLLMTTLKRYIFENFIFREEDKNIDRESRIFELFYFLIEDYENVDDLCLEEILSQLLLNISNFSFILKFFDLLLVAASKSFEVSLKYRVKILELCMNLNIGKEITTQVFKKLMGLNWDIEKIPNELKNQLKVLIISGKFLSESPFFLQLVLPWLSEEFTLQDLKNMIRLSSKYPALAVDFLSCLIETAHFNRRHFTHYKVSSENSIIFFPNYRLNRGNELSVWLRFSPEVLSSTDTLLQFELNNKMQLKLLIDCKRLSLELTKKKRKSILFSLESNINTNQWFLLGLQLFTSRKINGRKKIVLDFNNSSFEHWTDAINSFDHLNQIALIGSCKLQHINIYNTCVGREMFLTTLNQDQPDNLRTIGFSERHDLSRSVNQSFKAIKVKKLHLIDIILTAGNINLFLPILRKCEDFVVFKTFFKLLEELSQHKRFEELFDEMSFPVIKQIMIEKAYIVSMDWLEMCESFFQSLKSPKVYKEALEQLFLSPDLWSNLLDNCLLYYLECVKNRIKGIKCEITDEYLLLITDYFLQLASKVDSGSVQLVFYYLFEVLLLFFKHIDPAQKLAKLNLITPKLVSNMKNQQITEEITKFISRLSSQKVSTENEEVLDEFLFSISKDVSDAQPWNTFFTFYLNIVRKFFKKHFLNRPEEKKFVSKQISRLASVFNNQAFASVVQILCGFINSAKVITTELSGLIVVVVMILERVYETNIQCFEELFIIVSNYSRDSQKFSSLFIIHRLFPGFLFKFFKPWDSVNESIILFVETFFNKLEPSSNLNLLRVTLFELISSHNSSSVFKILKEIFFRSFENIGESPELFKLFEDFCNVVEDVISKVPYNEITEEYLELLIPLLRTLRNIEIYIDFPEISNFNAELSDSSQRRAKTTERNGGLGRQILLFMFLGLTFGPNPEIESFFQVFIEESQDFTAEKADWSGVSQDSFGKQSRNSENKRIQTKESLFFLYIYFEWSEIIKTYPEKNIHHEKLTHSVSNLLYFVKTVRIAEKIQREAKKALSISKISQYEKLLNENWGSIDSFYLKDSISSIKQLFESRVSTTCKKKRSGNEVLIMVNEYAYKLDNCKNSEQLMILLSKSEKFCEVLVFLFTLTSMKMNRVSQIETIQNLNYKYLPAEIVPSPVMSQIRSPELTPKIPTDYLFLYYFKKIEKEHFEFCGLFEDLIEGDLTLRKLRDIQGRQIFTKYKKKNEFFSVDSLYFSREFSEIYEKPANLGESSILEDSYFECPTFADLGFFIIHDLNPNEFDFECEIITSNGSFFGQLFIYEQFLVFTSKSTPKPPVVPLKLENGSKVLNSSALPESQILKKITKIWKFSDILKFAVRRFVHNFCSLEIFFTNSKSTFLNFFTTSQLLKVWKRLKKLIQDSEKFELPDKEIKNFTEKWQTGEISNFEYLMLVNRTAGRSFHDLSQYPVFPWVIKDFENFSIKFTREEQMRDLSYPIGAQSPENRERLAKNMVPKDFGLNYHFGCHYSVGDGILDFLIRVQPFTSEYKKFHNGQFDIPDRIFASISNMCKEVNQGLNTCRELIPEFFYLPFIFLNSNNENFRLNQSGKQVNNVKFPKWAKKNAFLFVSKHLKALESEYVSQNLHCWIDLIFGYKQQEPLAAASFNLYHPITYADKYQQIIKEVPDNFQKAYYDQAYHFGQVPFQLFKTAHPAKLNQKESASMFTQLVDKVCSAKVQKRFVDSAPIILLVSTNYLILIKKEVKITCSKFKLATPGLYDKKSEKKFELDGVSNTANLLAVLLKDTYLVTSGYEDYSVSVHDLNGVLHATFLIHSMKTNDLVGGLWIISASEDSTVALLQVSNSDEMKSHKFKVLHGHLSAVFSVTGDYKSSIVVSSSTFILVHHSLSGRILYKINENCSKVICSRSNLIFCQTENQIRVFYMNGKILKTYLNNRFKPFFVLEDFLILEQRDSIKVFNPFDDLREAEVHFGESLDILTVVQCKNMQTETILVVNSSSVFSLYSIEAFTSDHTRNSLSF